MFGETGKLSFVGSFRFLIMGGLSSFPLTFTTSLDMLLVLNWIVEVLSVGVGPVLNKIRFLSEESLVVGFNYLFRLISSSSADWRRRLLPTIFLILPIFLGELSERDWAERLATLMNRSMPTMSIKSLFTARK